MAAASVLRRLDRIGRTIETALLTLLLTGLIFLASSQIFLRNLFDTAWLWADALTDQLVLWLAMVGAIAATRDRKQISIDVLSRLLPAGLRLAASVLVYLFAAAVCGLIGWYGLELLVASRELNDTLLGLPAWYFQAVVPFGFGLIAYRYLILLLAALFGAGEEGSGP